MQRMYCTTKMTFWIIASTAIPLKCASANLKMESRKNKRAILPVRVLIFFLLPNHHLTLTRTTPLNTTLTYDATRGADLERIHEFPITAAESHCRKISRPNDIGSHDLMIAIRGPRSPAVQTPLKRQNSQKCTRIEGTDAMTEFLSV